MKQSEPRRIRDVKTVLKIMGSDVKYWSVAMESKKKNLVEPVSSGGGPKRLCEDICVLR